MVGGGPVCCDRSVPGGPGGRFAGLSTFPVVRGATLCGMPDRLNDALNSTEELERTLAELFAVQAITKNDLGVVRAVIESRVVKVLEDLIEDSGDAGLINRATAILAAFEWVTFACAEYDV